MEHNTKGQSFALLFFTFFIWGSVYVAGKLIADDLPPALVACLRCCAALLPLRLMSRRERGVVICREDRKYFALVGILGYFLTIFLIQLGISLTGAAMASLINALTPVAVTVLAALMLKEAITPVKIVCLALALAGAAVITCGAGTQQETVGIFVVLGAVLSWGFASVFMRRLTAKYPPILVTTYGISVSLIFHIPVGLFSAVTQPVRFSMKALLVILYLGFFGSGVSQFTWTKCLSLLPASTCSLFYPLQPVFAALLGIWLLGEPLTPALCIGLFLISLDVVLSTLDVKSASAAENR